MRSAVRTPAAFLPGRVRHWSVTKKEKPRPRGGSRAGVSGGVQRGVLGGWTPTCRAKTRHDWSFFFRLLFEMPFVGELGESVMSPNHFLVSAITALKCACPLQPSQYISGYIS